MAMQSDVLQLVTEIDDGSQLPFRLTLFEGVRERQVPIKKLVTVPKNIQNCIYQINELVDLKIRLDIAGDETLDIAWAAIHSKAGDSSGFHFLMSRENPTFTFYSTKNKDEDYPWRCGTYHFEINFKGKKYYGGFQINPKNINRGQFAKMHELINRELEGLATDYLKEKQTYGNFSDFEENSHWRFLQWYEKNGYKLNNALTLIESNSQNELKNKYVTENKPKHINYHSIKWQTTAKGQTFKNVKYLNRKLVLHWNTDSNQLVKYRMFLLLKRMNEVICFLCQIEKELRNERYEVGRDVDELLAKNNQIKMYKPVTDKDKKRIQNTLDNKKEELEIVWNQEKRVKYYTKKFRKSKKVLHDRMHTTFWSQVSNRLTERIIIGRHIGYQLFHQIWQEANLLVSDDGLKKVSLPVYKETAELYEYYVFFGVIDSFRGLGFSAKSESISEQLISTFFENGLKDGSTVILQRNSTCVHVTYDEMIEHDADIALKKDRNFYSGRFHRKPDIRIDKYVQTEESEDWKYLSSFIVEVKYSPFYNIHSKHAKTKAMEQMDDYMSIGYVQKKGVKKDYKRGIVEEVICIYPGDKYQKVKKDDQYGIFLQYYPNVKSDNLHHAVGKAELTTMLDNFTAQ